MRFHLRKALRLGWVQLNFTERGYSYTSIKIGPWTWNSRTRRNRLDTPGPGSVSFGGRRRR